MRATAKPREYDVTITMTASQWKALRSICEDSWESGRLPMYKQEVCLEIMSFEDLV